MMIRVINHIISHTNVLQILTKGYILFITAGKRVRFEWDEEKDREAQLAFLDDNRVIAQDMIHSVDEERLYCIGRVGKEIITVRFTYRGSVSRIYGAGYWRKGRKVYEAQNKIHR